MFRFKQFDIIQDQTAMKVGTDGVLLGAWVDCSQAQKILDVGAGTGLIAIMLAQQNPKAQITGIEIEENAYRQSLQNVNLCRWKDRIVIINNSYQEFYKEKTEAGFDLIVSNPPFYDNSHSAESEKRTLARHTSSLSFEVLITISSKLLHTKGLFSVIIPTNEKENFIRLAKENSLYLKRITTIFPNFEKLSKRTLLEFSKEKNKPKYDELTIEISRHNYTEKYKKLTKEFYLKF